MAIDDLLDEAAELVAIEDRLRRQLPDVDQQQLHAAVTAAAARFDGAPVRHYVRCSSSGSCATGCRSSSPLARL